MAEQQENLQTPLNELLAQARERKGMTLEEAAQKLNLTQTQLLAFEEQDLDVPAMSPFERGYLRNYAILLELDSALYEPLFPKAEEIGSELKSMRRFQYDAPKPLIKSGFLRFIMWLLFVLVMVALLWTLWPQL
ncbi:helix-turn-helix domain-containing protein [Thiomicrorhabdus cannonii]|uniref:helix-turn-helix domain-containing protein n=1 Tax=Thiomicrorhabdus cannonii TaxID=2748011 RepID=UPI0015BA6F8F|nr:helix-turn-helix domain-containing protein [Thiomicrorhabdus cannonii]